VGTDPEGLSPGYAEVLWGRTLRVCPLVLL